MFKSNNLENLHYIEPKSHCKIIFDNGTIMSNLINKDIIRENNDFYINLNNLKNIYERDEYDTIISSLSKFIKTFFKEMKNEKLFFQLDGNHNFKEEELTFFIFSAINEVSLINKDLLDKIGLDKSFQKHQQKIFEIIDEYQDYSLFYNKSNLILKKQLTHSYLFKHNLKEVTKVFNNDFSNHSNIFINFFNNLGENELCDPRLIKYVDKHFLINHSLKHLEPNKYDFYSISNAYKENFDYKEYLEMIMNITSPGQKYSISKNKKSKSPFYFFDINTSNENGISFSFSISISHDCINIENNKVFNSFKEHLNDLFSTTFHLSHNKNEETSPFILGNDISNNKRMLEQLLVENKKGNIEELHITEYTPIHSEIKEFLLNNFKHLKIIFLKVPQNKYLGL